MPKFFWYERNFSGSYSPVSSPEDPRNNEFRKKQKRFVVTELKPDEYDLPLTILARIYPPPNDGPGDVPTPAPPAPKPEPATDGATVEAPETVEEEQA